MKLFIGGKRPVRLVLGTLAVSALVTSACGGQSKAEDNASDKPADAAASPPGEGGGGSPTSTPASSSKKGGSQAGSAGATSTTVPGGSSSGSSGSGPKAATNPSGGDQPTRTLEMSAELAESCVRPGGTQTITVRTLPYSGVAFDTEYADYLTGMMPGHYGGNSAGFVDEDGTWTSTWVIAPNAPAGLTTVLVLGTHEQGGLGETKALFTVADALGKCA